jgi:hypothetical protein
MEVPDMRQTVTVLIALLAIGFLAACAGTMNPHGKNMPDPAAFNAHFDDMDRNGDGQVKWTEFKRYFPDAEPKVFLATDLNDDSVIDRDEWHQFKAAHGLKDE